MLKRRDFLRNSGAFALGSIMLSGEAKALFGKHASHAVGLQLYTLFNVIDNDVPGTLKKIAEIGYKEVESAFSKKGGYYGMKPKEFKEMVEGLGMTWQSHHVLGAPFKLPPNAKPPTTPDGKPISIPPMRNLTDNMQELVDEAAEGGIPYLVCASIPVTTLDDTKKAVEVLNKTGEACKKAGITFAYHNHDQEFKQTGDTTPYQMFLSQISADNMKMELDLCWSTKAGVDAVELFKQHPGRFPLWHVKDIDKDLKAPQPVGTGIIDFKRIFENAEVAGMKHFFVEHDMPADPIASITTSINNIHKMLG